MGISALFEILSSGMADERFELSFHPVVSSKQHRFIGVEVSYVLKGEESVIGIKEAQDAAKAQNFSLELDRLYRKKALEAFAPLYEKNTGYLLFLNFDSSIADTHAMGSGKFREMVEAAGFHPQNVVINLVERRAQNFNSLLDFVERHRNYGFLISCMEINPAQSDFERLSRLRPNILRVAPGISRGLEHSDYRQSFFTAISGLAERIGAMLMTEGMESDEDAVIAQELGADLQTGSLWGEYAALSDEVFAFLRKKNAYLAGKYKTYMINKIYFKEIRASVFRNLGSEFSNELSIRYETEFASSLSRLVNRFPLVECAYMLNSEGFQITDTIFGERYKEEKHSNLLFQPAPVGTDHSLKNYFIHIKGGEAEYFSDAYLSLATGSPCVTLAKLVKDKENVSGVLCLDINLQMLDRAYTLEFGEVHWF